MQLSFVTVDVFTDRQFGGNPLAVVLDGHLLTDDQMQAVAAEFNLAETTFVLPAKDENHTAEVRIFTPRAELPFAGHPNVGTAFALSTLGSINGRSLTGELLFEEKAGLVRIDLVESEGRCVGAMVSAPHGPKLGEAVALQSIAKSCGISIGDIDCSIHIPRVVSCGAPFVLVQLKSSQALNSASPDHRCFLEAIPMDLATGAYLYVASTEAASTIHARMFAPLYGIPEDPATGSAAAALVAFLLSCTPETDLVLDRKILQGEKMGRVSVINARSVKRAGKVEAIHIGGACVAVSQGVLTIATGNPADA